MNLARAELKLGVRMIYTAMFDEVNEGTGDMKLGASLGLGVSSLEKGQFPCCFAGVSRPS